jgi:hypothetical protein
LAPVLLPQRGLQKRDNGLVLRAAQSLLFFDERREPEHTNIERADGEAA